MRMKNPFVTAAQRSTYKKWEKSEPVNYSAHSFLFSCIWCVLKLFTEHLNDARHLESMRNFIQEGWFCQNKNLTSNLNDFEYFFPPLRLIPLKRRHRQLESVSRDEISFKFSAFFTLKAPKQLFCASVIFYHNTAPLIPLSWALGSTIWWATNEKIHKTRTLLRCVWLLAIRPIKISPRLQIKLWICFW